MNYPKITIVTPVFNQVKFVERAIKSVVNQNYPNLEYIIVDGGSTDGTLEIIKKYADKITKIISEPDEGMYFALNKGFQYSSGEIMAWINSDDMYHYNCLYTVAEIFEKFKETEFLMGQKTAFDENDRCFVTTLRNWSKYDFFIHKANWGIQQESTFWRRSLWERSGKYINTNYKLAADNELWIRFFITGNAILHMTNAILGGFRVREGQLSLNSKLYLDEVQHMYSQISISKEDQKILKKIAFYKRYLIKIPILRVLFSWNKSYSAFFNHPPYIKYDLRKKEFIKTIY